MPVLVRPSPLPYEASPPKSANLDPSVEEETDLKPIQINQVVQRYPAFVDSQPTSLEKNFPDSLDLQAVFQSLFWLAPTVFPARNKIPFAKSNVWLRKLKEDQRWVPVHLVVQGSVFHCTVCWPIPVENEAEYFFETIRCYRHPAEFVLRLIYYLKHHIAESGLSKILVPYGNVPDFVMAITLQELTLVHFDGHTAFRVHNELLAERLDLLFLGTAGKQ